MTDKLPVLSRPRDGAVFGGVCAGVARRLGIDPTVLRVIAVVSTIFLGGLGVALYVAGLLLLPRDQEQYSPLTRAIPLLRRMPPVALAVIVMALAVVITWGSGSSAVLVPAAIIAVVLWFVGFRRRSQASIVHTPEPTPFERAADAWRARLAEQQVPGFEGYQATEPRWQQPYTDPSDQWVVDNPPPVPAVPPRPKRSWRLWGLALALAGVGTGIVAALSIVFGFPAGAGAYFAAILAALGITAVVASRVGRPPLLIPAIIVTAVATAAVQFGPNPGYVGDYSRVITNEDQLQPVRVGAGSVNLDLSNLDLTQDRDLDVEVGTGDVTITLPREEATTVDWKLGLGELTFGDADFPVTTSHVDSFQNNPVGTAHHRITINLKVGAGDVTVIP
ncbi:MAG TPA: PspC domain-containing protein [Propionicimonas sp.]|nr:PspC domain-containing protein [Propionicimonas sp.]